MFLPVKTHDLVEHNGVRYLVTNVSLTSNGPIVEMLAVGHDTKIAHASEIQLIDQGESTRRAKTINMESTVGPVIKFAMPATVGEDTDFDDVIEVMETLVEEARKYGDEYTRLNTGSENTKPLLSIEKIGDRIGELFMELARALRPIEKQAGENFITGNSNYNSLVNGLRYLETPADVGEQMKAIADQVGEMKAQLPGGGNA